MFYKNNYLNKMLLSVEKYENTNPSNPGHKYRSFVTMETMKQQGKNQE